MTNTRSYTSIYDKVQDCTEGVTAYAIARNGKMVGRIVAARKHDTTYLIASVGLARHSGKTSGTGYDHVAHLMSGFDLSPAGHKATLTEFWIRDLMSAGYQVMEII